MAEGLIVKGVSVLQPQDNVADAFVLHMSRACRIALRDRPGGEASDACPPTGVLGVVPSGVLPKRHCCPVLATVSMVTSLSESSWTFVSEASGKDSTSDSEELVVDCFAIFSSFWALFRSFSREASCFILAKDSRAVWRFPAPADDVASSWQPPHVGGGPLHASRSHRISVCDKPGGEPTTFLSAFHFAPETGVFGTVPNNDSPKRHTVFDGTETAAPVALSGFLSDSTVDNGFDSGLQASRACLMAARDKPGGEPSIVAPADGVAGIVSNGVLPKRQRLPRLRPPLPSLHDNPDELSVSEVQLSPMSVVCSSSTSSTVATLETFSAKVLVGMSLSLESSASRPVQEVAITES